MGTEKNDLADMLRTLENDEQMESLEYLIEKLPSFVTSLQAAEDSLAFAMSAMKDQQSLSTIAKDTEEKIDRLHIDESHITAMMDLVQLLPRLTPVVQQLDDMLSFVESVAGDERSVDQLIKSTKETVNTYIPVEKGKEIFEETNETFEETKDSSDISIFGVMKMLKDPVVQDGLKYAQALLTVLNKRR